MEIARVKLKMLPTIGEITRNKRVFPQEAFDKMINSEIFTELRNTNQVCLTIRDYYDNSIKDSVSCPFVNLSEVVGKVKFIKYEYVIADIDKNIYDSILNDDSKHIFGVYPRVIAKPEYNPTTGVTTIRDARFVSFDLFVGRKP